jgi:1,4-alpha-glucan branching enzyme
MDLVLTLHSHLPYVLNHGRWPHGSDWICEAAVDTYLPLLEMLNALAVQETPCPVTLGMTPVLANQLAHPTFARELRAFIAQRLAAADEAIADFDQTAEATLTPIAEFWRGRLGRLGRLFDRIDGDLVAAFRRHAEAGRIEIISSAATHGFLPLLARDESIRLQLAVGVAEHRRLFGRAPAGCWVPECAYRPRGPWQPLPAAPAMADRDGIEDHLAEAGYRFFFTDSHLAQAGAPLSLYQDPDVLERTLIADDDALGLAVARSPYLAYQVGTNPGPHPVATLVRDPVSSRRVWSRHQGYPGDGGYLEFHKIRFPGGLKFWRVTDSQIDLGGKQSYDPNGARAKARKHAVDYARLLSEIADRETAAGGDLIAIPFDTELFGHWWFEGVDFLGDLYRALRRGSPTPVTASDHLAANPVKASVRLGAGSWGANGDFSKWLNRETEWTWLRLWPAEERFWRVAADVIEQEDARPVLEQAARELLLAQSSDWQFIISSATAADYATKRLVEHLANVDRLVTALEAPPITPEARTLAGELQLRDDLFPHLYPSIRAALARPGELAA